MTDPTTITISRAQYAELLGARYLQTWVGESLELGTADPFWLAMKLRSTYKASLSFADEAVARA